MTLLELLDYASVFVFALTGALVASRAQLDIVGFAFVAALTATGGGTVRDVVLDRNPVFWIAAPSFVGVAVAAAVVVFFTAHLFESRLKLLTWLDALALAVAVPAGTGVAMTLGHSFAIVLLMGVATGCLGGLMRDVVCNEVPLVLKQGELYVTAALAGAAAALSAAGTLGQGPALLLCAAVVFTLRAGSLLFGWRLPVYKSRPPRR
ncbi:trimeric intracellular cation channel family protein [Albidovulum sp.]|uniref:trimeric intracellular cation channel family protein n=1 Tax=Albidovulum sp. TaxID=1872424 RepID=UPI001DE1CDBE|nr:trimeric intracellular cation channel family protein [Paracoccaceae bacterium]MCC0045115.1 trimeric intracellular cation channel family protein [Defluviimonas sp.]MCB2121550.1 trimeric intracellular cation channel family protein [Paracoccaceae bacterium]MCB2138514.1 trimeric intracellular cation channel family protein [Paracoccaceae bacterium]MCB2142654.1 trimeric intracellular cation channel family protein [Paracoccaceae bacterium]